MPGTKVNRWLILFASLLCNLCIGSAYAWSIFRNPLMNAIGCTNAEISVAYSLNLGLVPLAMIVAGQLQDKQGPKKIIFFGGIVFALGIVGAGFSKSLFMIYSTYGVLGGLGIGIVYGCTVANTVKFFPDKRGLASGLVVGGFGSGAVLLGPLSQQLITSFSGAVPGSGVFDTLKLLGIIFLVVICACSFLITAPPAGYAPEGWTPPAPAAGASSASIDKNWKEMLSEPIFYVLWLMYAVGCISGLMFIAHASPMAQKATGITPAVAAAVVITSMGASNTIGRIFWGWISDKIGRYMSVLCMFIISGVAMFMLASVNSIEIFVVITVAIALCYGGVMGIFPSITADNFGAKNLGMNYGVLFTAFGVSALVGPTFAAKLSDMNHGDYRLAFHIAAGLCAVGIILVFIAMARKKKQVG